MQNIDWESVARILLYLSNIWLVQNDFFLSFVMLIEQRIAIWMLTHTIIRELSWHQTMKCKRTKKEVTTLTQITSPAMTRWVPHTLPRKGRCLKLLPTFGGWFGNAMSKPLSCSPIWRRGQGQSVTNIGQTKGLQPMEITGKFSIWPLLNAFKDNAKFTLPKIFSDVLN